MICLASAALFFPSTLKSFQIKFPPCCRSSSLIFFFLSQNLFISYFLGLYHIYRTGLVYRPKLSLNIILLQHLLTITHIYPPHFATLPQSFISVNWWWCHCHLLQRKKTGSGMKTLLNLMEKTQQFPTQYYHHSGNQRLSLIRSIIVQNDIAWCIRIHNK